MDRDSNKSDKGRDSNSNSDKSDRNRDSNN